MHTLSRACCKRCGVSSSVTPLYLNELNGNYFCSDCEDDLFEEYYENYGAQYDEPLTYEDN